MVKINDNVIHKKIGPVGINNTPFIDMGYYLDTRNFQNLHEEAILGLSLVEKFDLSYIVGEIPDDLRAEYGGQYLEAEILSNLDRFDPSGIHEKKMMNLTKQQRRRYCQLAFGAIPPWAGVVYLKYSEFLDKTSDHQWGEHSKHFPILKAYLNSLVGDVFEQIGRVLFFISYPQIPVVIHRDYQQMPHKDHSINFFFESGRPAFIYDETSGSKTYLSPDCRCYFFNNRDYHGVDAENRMRYTLRVDGTFSKRIQDKLGLSEGYVTPKDWETPA